MKHICDVAGILLVVLCVLGLVESDMHDLHKMDPPSIVSFLENLDKGTIQNVLASKSKRRRVVTDVDCDQVQDEIDNIEDSCDSHRFRVLMGVQNDFSALIAKNASLTSSMDRLTKLFGGDDSNPTLPGLWKMMYGQKLVVYGGVDPSSNRTVDGLEDLYGKSLSDLGVVFGRAEASLDSLWQAEDWMVNASTARLFKPVVDFSAAMPRMLADIQNLSKKSLDDITTNMTAYTADVQQQMRALVDAICKKQKQVDAANSKASATSSKILPELQNTVEGLIDAASDVMDKLNAAQDTGQKILHSLTDKVEQLLDSGQDGAAQLARKFGDSFRASVNQLLAAFAHNQSAADDAVRNSLSDELVVGMDGLLASGSAGQLKLSNFTSAFETQIERLKASLVDNLSAVALGQKNSFNSVEDSLSSTKEAASQLTGQLTLAKDQLQSTFGSAATELSASLNESQKIAVKQLLDSQETALQSLSSISQQMGQTSGQISSSLDGAKSLIAHAVARSQGSLAESGFSQSSLVRDQLTTIAQADYLGDGRVSTAQYGTRLAMEAQMKNVAHLVDGVSLNEMVNGLGEDIATAKSDILGAQTASVAAVRNMQTTTVAEGQMAVAAGYSRLASTGSQVQSNIRDGAYQLHGAHSALQVSQGKMSNLGQTANQWDVQTRNGIASVSEQLADATSALADRLSGKLTSGVNTAGELIRDQQSAVSSKINLVPQTQLREIIDGMRHVDSSSTGLDSTAALLRSTGTAVTQIAQAVDAVMAANQAEADRLILPVERSAQVAQGVKAGANFVAQLPRLGKEGVGIVQQVADAEEKTIGKKSEIISAKWSTGDDVLNKYDAKFASAIDEKMPGLVGKISDANSTFATNVANVEQDITRLGESVSEASRNMSSTLARMGAKLEADSDTRADQIEHLLHENETDATAAMNRILSEFHNALERDESVARIANDQLHVADEDILDPGNVLDGMMANVGDNVGQVQGSEQEGLAGLGNAADSATALLAQVRKLIEMHPELHAQVESEVNTATDASNSEMLELGSAVALANKTLAATLAHNSVATNYLIQSGGVQSGSLSQLADASVGSVGLTVSDTRTVLDAILQSVSDGFTQANTELEGVNSLSQAGADSLDLGASAQRTLLAQNLTADQMVYRLELGQVRTFVQQMASAWGNYTDFEWEKWTHMKDADQLNLNLLANGLNGEMGKLNDTLSAVETQVRTLGDSVKEMQADGGFYGDIAANVTMSRHNVEQFQNETLVQVENMENSLLPAAEPTSNITVATLTENKFEQGIDSIVRQVLEATLSGSGG